MIVVVVDGQKDAVGVYCKGWKGEKKNGQCFHVLNF